MKGLILLVPLVSFLVGCSATESPVPGTPEGSVVTKIEKPYDPSRPRTVLVLEPIAFRSPKERTTTDDPFALPVQLLHSTLLSSLLGIENLAVVDQIAVKSFDGGKVAVPKQKGEGGPFIVRVVVTELNGYASVEEDGVNAMGLGDSAGEAILRLPVMVVGFWVTTLTNLPTQYSTQEIQGMVGLDVTIIDGSNGKILRSFPVQGTHTQKVRQIGNFVSGYYEKESSESALEGAIREAFNSAALRIYDEVSSAGR